MNTTNRVSATILLLLLFDAKFTFVAIYFTKHYSQQIHVISISPLDFGFSWAILFISNFAQTSHKPTPLFVVDREKRGLGFFVERSAICLCVCLLQYMNIVKRFDPFYWLLAWVLLIPRPNNLLSEVFPFFIINP